MEDYLDRAVDPLISELLREMPAILLVGARAVGKTTTATRFARTVVRLDREAEAVAFGADPDAALRGLQEPVLIDEWQVVPSVLGAVKRTVDDDPRPGRFLLTGSVRADLESETWPGTGRLIRVTMTGLSQREMVGGGLDEGPLTRLVRDGPDALIEHPAEALDLRGYIEVATSGMFPAPVLQMGEIGRRRWLVAYLQQLITRDATLVGGERDPVRLRRYVEACAASTACVVEAKKLYDAAGLNAKTAAAYDRLLANLYLADLVPAWMTNRLKRLVRLPKRYFTDPGLAVAALGMDSAGLLRDGDLLGRILDTFVVAQVRNEVSAMGEDVRLYHLRTEQGRHELDLLLELPDGRVIGVEVKAEAAPARDSARHLLWLADRLDDRFVAGLVFHTGPRAYRLDPRVLMLPICSLWA